MITLTSKVHNLSFTRSVDGKPETFRAVYNEEKGGILFDGILRYPLEIDELLGFLSMLKEERRNTLEEASACECGSKDLLTIGKGVWHWGGAVGNEYDILRCKSCGRERKRVTVHY